MSHISMEVFLSEIEHPDFMEDYQLLSFYMKFQLEFTLVIFPLFVVGGEEGFYQRLLTLRFKKPRAI